jgi:hypothetical protein
MLESLFRPVSEDQILHLIDLQNGMTVNLFHNRQSLQIHFVDGHSNKMPLDITKTIEDLGTTIFKCEKPPWTLEYILFSLEEEAPKPLDAGYSIPEQCRNWQQSLRLSVISGFVLGNRIAVHAALAIDMVWSLSGSCNGR